MLLSAIILIALIIIGICLFFRTIEFIRFCISTSYKSEEKKETTHQRNTLHCTVNNISDSYSTILNRLSTIVYKIVTHCQGKALQVYVCVEKIDNSNCSVTLQLEDFNYKVWGISFGEEFDITDDCFISFITKSAKEFSNPETVKQEIILQFTWSDITVKVNQIKVLDYGDFIYKPMVMVRFTAMYKG